MWRSISHFCYHVSQVPSHFQDPGQVLIRGRQSLTHQSPEYLFSLMLSAFQHQMHYSKLVKHSQIDQQGLNQWRVI